MEKVFEIYIKTTPERLWEAITNTEMRRKYNFGLIVESDWTPGSRYEGRSPDTAAITVPGEADSCEHTKEMPRPKPPGSLILEGENLEVDPPRRLVQNFRALWGEDVKNEGTSRVTWEIEPVGDSCRLTVTHNQLRDDANSQLYGGWPMILSGIKTLLETGEMLTTPASLLYAAGPKPGA
jgi:uncharacterized protein YndB with AHSA1/START domain